MKQLLHNLFLPLFTAALCSGACSDDDNDSRPKPSGYDIYTAGYKTPSGKSVATVWKNSSELYALTDGTNDAWAIWLPGKLSSFIDSRMTLSKSRLRVSRIPIICTPSSGSPS